MARVSIKRPPVVKKPAASARPIPPMPPGAEKLGAWFDERAADMAVRWFRKYLRHTEAEWAKRPFVLAEWQQDRVIRPLFGWKRADGTRLYRRLWLELPRKNGKTELAAGIALLLLAADGENGGQGYSLAVDEAQAQIVFGKASRMVTLNPELGRQVTAYKTSLWCQALLSSFKPFASGAESKHGFGPSFAIGDEVHVWPDGELLDVVHKGTAHRAQPVEILITTAGLRGHGFAWEQHEYAEKVASAEIIDPTLLVVIYAAGEDDDWTAEDTWRKANPGYGVSVKVDYLKEECAKARRSPRLENAFKRFHLDLWTEQVTRWLPIPEWDSCTSAPANGVRWRELETELRGKRCWGGLDLASTRDVNALAWVFEPIGGRVPMIWRFFLPEADIEARIKAEALPWDQWIAAGLVTPTPGNVTDYTAIKSRILDRDAEQFELAELAIDRWNSSQLAVELQGEGLTVALFGQGYASMSSPAKEFERLVLSGGLEHGNNPVARAMAKAVSVETDEVGNIKPVKTVEIEGAGMGRNRAKRKLRRPVRVDGIVAGIMGLGRRMVAPAPRDLDGYLRAPVSA